MLIEAGKKVIHVPCYYDLEFIFDTLERFCVLMVAVDRHHGYSQVVDTHLQSESLIVENIEKSGTQVLSYGDCHAAEVAWHARIEEVVGERRQVGVVFKLCLYKD